MRLFACCCVCIRRQTDRPTDKSAGMTIGLLVAFYSLSFLLLPLPESMDIASSPLGSLKVRRTADYYGLAGDCGAGVARPVAIVFALRSEKETVESLVLPDGMNLAGAAYSNREQRVNFINRAVEEMELPGSRQCAPLDPGSS